MLEVKHIKNIIYAVDDADIIYKQEIVIACFTNKTRK